MSVVTIILRTYAKRTYLISFSMIDGVCKLLYGEHPLSLVNISIRSTQKLKMSILGDCSGGMLASGAAYTGQPGSTVRSSCRRLTEL